MHYLAQQLADDHIRQLRETARRSRPARARARGRRRSARHLAGWTLIEIGLKLTSTPGDA